MPATQIATFAPAKLEPYINPHMARTLAVQMGVSLTIARGTLVAQKSADSKFYAYAGINQVQTIKIAGTLTAGTWRIRARKADGSDVWTTALAYNASAADITAALVAALGTGAATAVIATDYATGIVVTFSGTGYAGITWPLMLVDDNDLTTATSVSVADTTTLTGGQIAVGIMVYDIVTDSTGQVILGASGSVQDLNHVVQPTAEIYYRGTFLESDLTGLDAAAVTALKAREIGVGANKMLEIP